MDNESEIMDEKIIAEYRKAGEVSKKAKKLASEIVKPGANYFEVCSKLRELILKNKCGSAFPVNTSVNEVAAHDTAKLNDERTFKKEDIVKIDIGVHSNGYIADTALTFNWDDKHNELKNSRLGITVSKKVGCAVRRNRIKRIIREFFRTNRMLIESSADINVIAKRSVSFVENHHLFHSLKDVFKKIDN